MKRDSKSTTLKDAMRDDDHAAVEIPSRFICPITLAPMRHPLMTRSGLNYDRDAILSWLETSGCCPLTRSPMTLSDLIPNRVLQEQIERWVEQNDIDLKGFDDAEKRTSDDCRVYNFFQPSAHPQDARLVSCDSDSDDDDTDDNSDDDGSERRLLSSGITPTTATAASTRTTTTVTAATTTATAASNQRRDFGGNPSDDRNSSQAGARRVSRKRNLFARIVAARKA